jgi:hypothetical protein
MFQFDILVYFQFVQIKFIYFPYLFLIQSLGPSCLQINARDTYNLWFGHSLYAWKDKEIIFPMQLVSWSIKIRVAHNYRNKIIFQYHRNAIFPFHETSSLAPACTQKYKIIPFYNTLMTNLLITCQSSSVALEHLSSQVTECSALLEQLVECLVIQLSATTSSVRVYPQTWDNSLP